jgi:hypothetical protein
MEGPLRDLDGMFLLALADMLVPALEDKLLLTLEDMLRSALEELSSVLESLLAALDDMLLSVSDAVLFPLVLGDILLPVLDLELLSALEDVPPLLEVILLLPVLDGLFPPLEGMLWSVLEDMTSMICYYQ